MHRWSSRWLLAVAASLSLMALPALGAEPLKIRLSWVVAPPVLSPVLFLPPGVTRHYGATYTVESLHFPGTPTMITALATGDLDIGTLGFSSMPTAIVNARMTDLRIIADEFQDGVEGYYSSRYLVLKDGAVNAVEDLKGKVIATNGIGSGIDMAMRAMLRAHGLEDRRDYSAVEIAFPNMRATLAEKKVDMIMLGAGFAYDPEVASISRILFTMRDAMKSPAQQSMWVVRGAFLAKNRAALVDMLEDELRGLRWFLDPANRPAAIKLLAEFSKLPPERLEPWVLDHHDYYRDPDGMPDLAAIQKNIETQKQLGFLKADLDVQKYADLSLVAEAASRLK